LAAGEIGFETDTNQFKIGDGVNEWEDISYFQSLESLGGTFDDYVLLSSKGEPNGVATLDTNGLIPIDQLQLLVDAAPETLDTLGELATAIQDSNNVLNNAITDAVAAETNARGLAITSAINQEVSDRNGAITADISSHNSDTTNVHGIADTSLLATATTVSSAVSSHNSDTTNVHGIADTSELATLSDVAAVTATSLGLGNVNNTSDLDKPVSIATETAISTAKAEAIAEVTAVIDSAPAALDTLNELAAALGDDANFASTVTTALDAKVASYTSINQKTSAYTPVLTDRDKLIEINSGSAVTLTIPANGDVAYPVGTSFDILQTGAGQVTIAGGNNVTVNATPGLKLRTQWSSATIFKRAENTWVVYGDLSA
jgi:hypothetical protein